MNSCTKGRRGEEELARILRRYGFEITRGGTCSFGEAPDLSGLPGLHIECKRVEKLNLSAAMAQSIRDSKRFGDGIPTVFHRKNREDWLVTLQLADFMQLYMTANDMERGCTVEKDIR